MSQEYCFLWIDHWSTCMTKAEWSGWMQTVGALLAIVISVGVAYWSVSEDKRRQRIVAASILSSFGGALRSVEIRFPTENRKTEWDARLMRVVLEAELDSVKSIPRGHLSNDEQIGVLSFKLAAHQLIEALKLCERGTEKIDDVDWIRERTYNLLLDVIKHAGPMIEKGRKHLGDVNQAQNS